MKKWLIAVVLVAMLVLLSACGFKPGKGRTLNAKVRYFDGSSEMIELKSFFPKEGYAILETIYGDEIRVGWNNVIIIEEDAKRE